MAQPLRNQLTPPTPRQPANTYIDDLPVNPLWLIHVTLQARTTTGTPSPTNPPTPAQLLSLVDTISVRWRGSTVMELTPAEAALITYYATHLPPTNYPTIASTTAHHTLTFTLALGRKHKNGTECFPATRRGELTLHRTYNADPSAAGLDPNTIVETIHTTELLGADPSAFLKATRLQRTSSTTGDNDIDLPLGNPIAAIWLHSPNPNDEHPPNGTITTAKLLVDNVEWDHAFSSWHMLSSQLAPFIPPLFDFTHTHYENIAPNYTQNQPTSPPTLAQEVQRTFGLMDFDPFRNDEYYLQTAGRGRVHIRYTSASPTVATAIPLEIISIPK